MGRAPLFLFFSFFSLFFLFRHVLGGMCWLAGWLTVLYKRNELWFKKIPEVTLSHSLGGEVLVNSLPLCHQTLGGPLDFRT